MMFIFTLLITDFFDTMGTMVAVGQEGDLLDDEGMPPRTREILLVDSIAAAAGGAASVSSNTSYIESASGVAEGARTGVANLVTGVLFLLAMFLAPLVTIVPFEAASTALVVVGFLMMTAVRQIDWTDYEIAIPAFLAITLMPFTYSISNGIGAGIISYVVIKVAVGQGPGGAPAAVRRGRALRPVLPARPAGVGAALTSADVPRSPGALACPVTTVIRCIRCR